MGPGPGLHKKSDQISEFFSTLSLEFGRYLWTMTNLNETYLCVTVQKYENCVIGAQFWHIVENFGVFVTRLLVRVYITIWKGHSH